ncbi:MAG TPA: LuxR C-terminal-related transcriptional regulator [Jatrophihabitans sp.]|nr:LuxR C-terminal-related transcriptional regulator [Jatrophihabitans sp.]
MVRLPAEQILLATAAARTLLGSADPVGRTVQDFLVPPLGGAGELLARGRLAGVQLRRVLLGERAEELELWITTELAGGESAAGSVPVLALLFPAGAGLSWATGEGAGKPAASAAGWADRHLLLQQIGGDVGDLLGLPAEELVGRSLFSLFAPADLTSLLFGLGQLTGSRQAVNLAVRLTRPDRSTLPCRLVLEPLGPSPACAFAIQPAEPPGQDPLLPLRRFGQGIAAARGARELTLDRTRTALSELTSRELQIVNRLLAGDRVPAISRQLYLAQSTVRNHLSAVFAKLGVRSQQELIVLLRRAMSDD